MKDTKWKTKNKQAHIIISAYYKHFKKSEKKMKETGIYIYVL